MDQLLIALDVPSGDDAVRLAGSLRGVAGGLKILYDGLVYLAFREVRPPEERARTARGLSPR